MREEYDLKKQKVKRRGVLPGLQGEDIKQAKVRITISLDQDVVDRIKHKLIRRYDMQSSRKILIILKR